LNCGQHVLRMQNQKVRSRITYSAFLEIYGDKSLKAEKSL